jgi:purine nucleosidase
MPVEIILDTDIATDVDDLLALALVLASPELHLRGVTCVYGDVELRARYAARLLALAGRTDIPVMAGARRPLLNKRPIFWVGHEGSGVLHTGEPISYSAEDAVDFIVRMAHAHPDGIHLVAIAPLTNIALALIRDPRLPLRHITLMGGVIRSPNRLDLPFAEHNIACDPEAAHRVFASGLPITIVPLDLTTQVRLTRAGEQRLRTAGSAFQRTVAEQVAAYPFFAAHGYTFVHDPLAVASIIDPTLIETQRVAVQVELGGEYSAGVTLMRADPDSPVAVGTAVDAARFEALLIERLAHEPI